MPWSPQVRSLKKLPWIVSARKGRTVGARRIYGVQDAFIIKTKPKFLKTKVTRGVNLRGTQLEAYPGEKLATPLVVEIPQYEIALTPLLDYVEIRLAKRHKMPKEGIIPFPTQVDRRVYKQGQWTAVCPGSYSQYYDYTDDYAVKAQVIGELLQEGLAHFSFYRSKSVFAYLLGLLPPKFVTVNETEVDYGND